jgi:hypothetical protein
VRDARREDGALLVGDVVLDAELGERVGLRRRRGRDGAAGGDRRGVIRDGHDARREGRRVARHREERDLTTRSTTPIHTGEQIYLRHNYKDLIEMQAVNIIGPDPCDVGGLAELKWVAEYADLHGILIAPHGTGNGLIGLAALVQVCATLPENYIAFEYPTGSTEWWSKIVVDLPNIDVWDRPGLGVDIDPEAARPYLPVGDEDFFTGGGG